MINFFLLVSVCVDFLLALLIYKKTEKNSKSRIFAMLSIAFGIWTFFIFLFRYTSDYNAAFLFNQLFIVFAGFIPSLFLHFVFNTTNRTLSLAQKALLHIPNIFIVFAVVFPNAMVQDVVFHDWGKESVIGPFYHVFNLYFSGYVMWGIYEIYRGIKRSHGLERMRLVYFFWTAILTSLIGTYFNLYLVLLGNYKYIWVGPYNSLVMASLMTFTILKTDLMDIRLVMTRTVSRLFVVLFMVISFVVLNKVASQLLSSEFVVVLDIFLAYFWMVYGNKLREILQTSAETKWIKDHYNSGKLLSLVSSKIQKLQDRKRIFQEVSGALYSELQPESFLCFVANQNEDGKVLNYESFTSKGIIKEEHLDTALLVDFFSEQREPIFFSKVPHLIQQSVFRFDSHGYDEGVVIPFYSPEGLESVLFLTKRSSEAEYSESDFDFFEQLTGIVSPILYRLTPYEKIEKQYFETQKKLHEAQVMRIQSKKNEDLAFVIQEYNHEIRTPLQAIMTYAEFLPEDDSEVDISEIINARSVILRSAERANDIVATTLTLTPSDMSDEFKEKLPLNVNDVVRRVQSNYVPNNFEALEVSLEDNLPAVSGVYDDLRKVVSNLVKNADEALDNGGSVAVSTYVEYGEVVIEVSDTGHGIPASDIDKIWEPYRSKNVTKGRGLGLSIVHRIVTQHAGRVTVSSDVNKGTVFKIYLSICE